MKTREGTPIDAGIIARVANGVRGFISGIKGNSWFSPGQPIPPQEPDALRIFPYPSGYNIDTAPRATEGVSFQQLRALADNCDMVRLAIETRKDQMGALDFSIQAKKDEKVSNKKIKEIKNKLVYPDNQHPWSTWLRILIEDLLVIDAPTIYPRLTLGGDLYGLDVIDGSTIKRLIDDQGRTPSPPSPAYQQNLYGIPAVNFNRDELIYMPRNPRAHKIYGYSPVEQIIITINIALRRQTHQLQYYTDGSIPDAYGTLPAGWEADKIKQFQDYFDLLLGGDTGNRRKIKWTPEGTKITPLKEVNLKDEYDEWLARIICFSFSLSPTPFIKLVNRSTAEAAAETALEEGLAPLKQWIKDLMDYVIAKYFKCPEAEFSWMQGETEQDPLTKAQIQDMKIKNGTLTVNEAREEDGREALSEGELLTINNSKNNNDNNDPKEKDPTDKKEEKVK